VALIHMLAGQSEASVCTYDCDCFFSTFIIMKKIFLILRTTIVTDIAKSPLKVNRIAPYV